MSGEMKLGILSPAFPPVPCAESEFVFLLAEGLSARGNQVHVFSPLATPAPERSTRFTVTKAVSFFETVSALLAADLTTLLVPYQPWLFQKNSAYRIALKVFHALRPGVALHLLYFNPAANYQEEWSQFPLFTTIHVLSERHRLAFAARFPALEKRLIVTPVFSLAPPVTPLLTRAEAKAELGLPPSKFLWVSLGYLFPGKGVETLLRALARLTEVSLADTHLAVVGGTMAPEFSGFKDFLQWLRLIAESLGVADRVTWVTDFKSESFPTRWLQAADSAAVPLDVGLGSNHSSVATLCGFGIPLVSFRGDFLDPEFEDRRNCLLAEQRSSVSLAAAMGQLQAEADLRQTLAQGAARLGRTIFSREAALDNWNTILHRSMPHSGVYLSHAETMVAPHRESGLLGRTAISQN